MTIKKLNELSPFQHGTIVTVRGFGPLRQRMIDMGLVKGAAIKVVRCAPLGDPVEYQIKGYNLSLRKQEAEHILVEEETFPLSHIQDKVKVRVIQIYGGRNFKQRIDEMGIQTNMVINASREGDGGPLFIKTEEREVKIGQGMAQKILVETIE